jgi:uncharacterized protein (DUF2147 family)
MRVTLHPTIALLAACAALPAVAQQAPAVTGHWLSEARDGVVDIEPCGAKLCGKIIWIKNPLDKDGRPRVDDQNPKPELRSRPRCNLVMMGNFVATGTNEWGDGWIYDPASGKTYDAKMRLEGDQLRLRGFVGISLFGASQTWTRADPSLANCDKG